MDKFKKLVEIEVPCGRLVDADELYNKFVDYSLTSGRSASTLIAETQSWMMLFAANVVKNAPTIVEAQNET